MHISTFAHTGSWLLVQAGPSTTVQALVFLASLATAAPVFLGDVTPVVQ